MNARTKIIIATAFTMILGIGAVYGYSTHKNGTEDEKTSSSAILSRIEASDDAISPDELKKQIKSGLDMNGIVTQTEDSGGNSEEISYTILQRLIRKAPTLALTAIEAGPIDGINHDGDSALLHACNAKSSALVEKLLAKGANPSQINKFGRSALHALFLNSAEDDYSQEEEKKILALLLQHGANPNLRDNVGSSVLAASLHNGTAESVRTLLKQIKQIDLTPDNDGDTLLHYAAMGTSADSIKIVLNEITGGKGFVNKKNKSGMTPLMIAMMNPGLSALLAAGADMSVQDDDGDRLLTYLAATNDLKNLVLSLRAGADPNYSNQLGITPLHYAISACNGKAAAALIKAGAKTSVSDATGVTPAALAKMKLDDCEDGLEKQYLKKLAAGKR